MDLFPEVRCWIHKSAFLKAGDTRNVENVFGCEFSTITGNCNQASLGQCSPP